MWMETFVLSDLQLCKSLTQTLGAILMFIVCILIFHCNFLLLLLQGEIQRAPESFQLLSGQVKYINPAWGA